MAITGQTLFRFCGALLLGLGATTVDRPRPTRPVQPPAPPRTETGVALAPVATEMELSISPGMRAMAIPIRTGKGFADSIVPNARVDVLLLERSPRRERTTLIQPNLRVLSVGTIPQRNSDGMVETRVVAVVEVTPTLAVKLATAGSRGEFALLSHTAGPNGGPIPSRLARPETVNVRVNLGGTPR
jgi:Flp pilus assembly protein CpaB